MPCAFCRASIKLFAFSVFTSLITTWPTEPPTDAIITHRHSKYDSVHYRVSLFWSVAVGAFFWPLSATSHSYFTNILLIMLLPIDAIMANGPWHCAYKRNFSHFRALLLLLWLDQLAARNTCTWVCMCMCMCVCACVHADTYLPSPQGVFYLQIALHAKHHSRAWLAPGHQRKALYCVNLALRSRLPHHLISDLIEALSKFLIFR